MKLIPRNLYVVATKQKSIGSFQHTQEIKHWKQFTHQTKNRISKVERKQ
jgi:hypothetical protein